MKASSSFFEMAESVVVSGKLCTARNRLTFWASDGLRLAISRTSCVAGTIFSMLGFGLATARTAATAMAPTSTTPVPDRTASL